jgi:hypothetical protein
MRRAGAKSWPQRRGGWLALALLPLLLAPPAAALEARGDPDPQQLLNAAFARRYSCSITGVVHISTRKGEARARDRRLHIAAKFVQGRLHTYAIFREPQYVRGMAFLGVESEDPSRSEQQFVYLPSMAKVRRVSGSQPTDSFLGTDLSYHDFQRQQPERYRATGAAPGRAGGEAIRTVSVLPLFDAPYSHVEYEIAVADAAILGTRYYKGAELAPYKVMRMPRATMVEQNGCSVPSRVIVDDRRRGTHTELTITELRTNADLDDALFTYTALEARREIPGIQDR